MTAAKFALPAATLLLAMMLLAAAGCNLRRSTPAGAYETVPADPGRDTAAARRHNSRALELIERDQLPQAEAELKSALEADLFFAPAHNNLGTVYLRQEKYYLAAWQFQYAVKLTPSKAAPRNNLGLVFEAVGRLDDAADCYDKALALDADAVEVAANLARIHLRTGRKTPRTRQLLNDIILKHPRPHVTTWARRQLALLPPPEPVQPPAEGDTCPPE